MAIPAAVQSFIAELRALARTHAPDAIEELARLAVKARSATARVAAIRELLDRGYSAHSMRATFILHGLENGRAAREGGQQHQPSTRKKTGDCDMGHGHQEILDLLWSGSSQLEPSGNL